MAAISFRKPLSLADLMRNSAKMAATKPEGRSEMMVNLAFRKKGHSSKMLHRRVWKISEGLESRELNVFESA
jgi:hypothetical protein